MFIGDNEEEDRNDDVREEVSAIEKGSKGERRDYRPHEKVTQSNKQY